MGKNQDKTNEIRVVYFNTEWLSYSDKCGE